MLFVFRTLEFIFKITVLNYAAGILDDLGIIFIQGDKFCFGHHHIRFSAAVIRPKFGQKLVEVNSPENPVQVVFPFGAEYYRLQDNHFGDLLFKFRHKKPAELVGLNADKFIFAELFGCIFQRIDKINRFKRRCLFRQGISAEIMIGQKAVHPGKPCCILGKSNITQFVPASEFYTDKRFYA
ncbi:hypothetical protein D3C85_769050 [compost metagenome]